MRQTISFITLGVADLPASRAFYARLGWQESSGSQPEVAFYAAGGLVFALFGRAALAADANVPPAGSGFPGFALAHNVDSPAAVDRLLAEAVAAGGCLTQAAGKVSWGGYRGYFADPDGYLWEVCWNPFFPLDAAGRVQLPE